MRDLLNDLSAGQPNDPIEAARRGMRPKLRARFYAEASVRETTDGFAVQLDGKEVRTPARRALMAPVRPLAAAMATEWEAQKDVIEPAKMPLTRLANVIVDAVASAPVPVADEVEDYLRSDLVFYRADAPEDLVARQAEQWDPLLAWVRDTFGARFILVQGVSYTKQPEAAIAAMARMIPRDASQPVAMWRLGALASATTLAGSALIALALAAERIDRDAAWAAANVDEDWNTTAWGDDPLARERRDYRFKEFQAAALVLELLRSTF
jgi:chaperone required for assembly of F1-ATPase